MIEPLHEGTVSVFGIAHSISLRMSHSKGSSRRSVVYIDAPAPEDIFGMSIPPHSIKGEDRSNDQLWKTYNKNELKIQKVALQMYHDLIAKKLFVQEMSLKFKFSREAGCSCGCSPGWRVYDGSRRTGIGNFFVSMKKVVASPAVVV